MSSARSNLQMSQNLANIVTVTSVLGEPEYAMHTGAFSAPELPSAKPTTALATVRRLFRAWELDASNYGTVRWNPLGTLVPEGSRIVIKPNWVYHEADAEGVLECLITHTSVIEAVLAYLALTRPEKVVVGDAPLQSCSFPELRRVTNIDSTLDWARSIGIDISIADFRRTIVTSRVAAARRTEDARPIEDYVLFDLGPESVLEALEPTFGRYRVTAYDPAGLASTHATGRHQYLVAREVIDADVVINLPKLKCHSKVCITGALKNLVGINGHKEYLPHHRKGSVANGGDCYPGASLWKRVMEDIGDVVNKNGRARPFRWALGRALAAWSKGMAAIAADPNVEGNWYGNDTIWRTCIDLNRILIYGTSTGRLQADSQRRIISITDAIIAGEGEGPLRPVPVRSGFLTGAVNAAAADYVHARLMGLDPDRIPLIRGAFSVPRFPVAACRVDDIFVRGIPGIEKAAEIRPVHLFRPPRGWVGHCEFLDKTC